MPPTIAHYYDSRGEDQNNFRVIRYVAAALVIYGHSYPIVGIPGTGDLFLMYVGHLYIGALALNVFFVISGFLVTASFVRGKSVARYCRSRFLRIVPGMVVCMIVCAFVIGPLFTNRSLLVYLADPSVYRFVFENLTFVQTNYSLPGVFSTNPTDAVDGPLWSITLEVRLYILLLLIGVAGVLRNKHVLNFAMLAVVLLGAFSPNLVPVLQDYQVHRETALFFIAGALLYINRHDIPLNHIVMFFLLFVAVVFHDSPHFTLAFGVFTAYAVMWFAYVPRIRWLNLAGDYSFGLYIYGWPVQQILRTLMPDGSPEVEAIVSLVAATAIAMLSWHLIEKPALSLKQAALQSPLTVAAHLAHTAVEWSRNEFPTRHADVR